MIEDIDTHIRYALDDLRRVIYETEPFRDTPPCGAHDMPAQVKLRLWLLTNLYHERGDALRAMRTESSHDAPDRPGDPGGDDDDA